MDDVDKCANCWRSGPERDGCNCVLELTPPTHPEHVNPPASEYFQPDTSLYTLSALFYFRDARGEMHYY